MFSLIGGHHCSPKRITMFNANNLIKILLILQLSVLTGACSSLNESLWHGLKDKDAHDHPELDEEKRRRDPPIEYIEYDKERKTILTDP